MAGSRFRIGIVAPASRISRELADSVAALAQTADPSIALDFHPQCFEAQGHFAGNDEMRAAAFLDFANDPAFGAVWFARGGYGSGRIAEKAVQGLTPAAKGKIYLGYSDLGYLLAGLYKAGCKVAHGPMPADLRREGGDKAVVRGLRFLVERAPDTLEPSIPPSQPCAAFNITVLNHILGTALEPDLTGHVLMLEEVSEHMYRIDRSLHHITSFASIRRIAAMKLGRCSDVPPNDPDFEQHEEDVMRHWCKASGIAYRGRADIGHDGDNKVVPFGPWPWR